MTAQYTCYMLTIHWYFLLILRNRKQGLNGFNDVINALLTFYKLIKT